MVQKGLTVVPSDNIHRHRSLLLDCLSFLDNNLLCLLRSTRNNTCWKLIWSLRLLRLSLSHFASHNAWSSWVHGFPFEIFDNFILEETFRLAIYFLLILGALLPLFFVFFVEVWALIPTGILWSVNFRISFSLAAAKIITVFFYLPLSELLLQIQEIYRPFVDRWLFFHRAFNLFIVFRLKVFFPFLVDDGVLVKSWP